MPAVDSIYVGSAGWSIPKGSASHFPATGSQLERYSQVLTGVEINTTFYRSHRASTYERWRNSVPDTFRFSVKMPRQITHMRRLHDVGDLLTVFLEEISVLGAKLGCVLVQLPPSLKLEDCDAETFFHQLRRMTDLPVVCEPRHASWFSDSADHLLEEYRIARAAVDPATMPESTVPAGCRDLSYFRWHGSPRMYYSAYDAETLRSLVQCLRDECQGGRTVWCIFDNTAAGAAAENAVHVKNRVAGRDS